jgi:hypothetical protein
MGWILPVTLDAKLDSSIGCLFGVLQAIDEMGFPCVAFARFRNCRWNSEPCVSSLEHPSILDIAIGPDNTTEQRCPASEKF